MSQLCCSPVSDTHVRLHCVAERTRYSTSLLARARRKQQAIAGLAPDVAAVVPVRIPRRSTAVALVPAVAFALVRTSSLLPGQSLLRPTVLTVPRRH